MNKQEFLDKLSKHLKDNNIVDIDEIIAEYEEHFRFKLADGYSEEEIIAKFDKPEVLAKQFVTGNPIKKPQGIKAFAITAIIFSDIFMSVLFIFMFVWVFAMLAIVIAAAAIGVCLIININAYNLLPSMPYWCAFIFSVSFFSLAILSLCGTIYCAAYVKQLFRAYCRWHNNCIAIASGKPVLPPLSKHPKLENKTYRKLRNASLVSVTIFAVSLCLFFVVSIISSGSLGFWHTWNWFV